MPTGLWDSLLPEGHYYSTINEIISGGKDKASLLMEVKSLDTAKQMLLLLCVSVV